MAHVRIVQLGPLQEQLNLEEVLNKANRSQEQYIFRLDDPLEYLGEPTEDEGGRQYKFDILADLLQSKRDTAQILIGVTDHAIYDKMFSAVNSDLTCILISTADIEEVINTQKTSMAGYVLFEMGAQLLTIEYRRNLRKIKSAPEDCAEPWHKERRTCVFDWDEERRHTGQKIASPKICEMCSALLYKAGVAQTLIDATTSLVGAGLTPIRTILKNQARDPIILVLLAALLGSAAGLKVFSTASWWLQPYILYSLALVILLLYPFWEFSRNK